MTTLTKESKQAQASRAKKPAAQGAGAVVRVLEAFALMPLHALAEGRNQSIPSLLHDLTGLSKARISKGNINAVRPSTLRKIHEHQRRQLKDHLTDQEALADAREKISTAPQTRSGAYASLAGWLHQFEILPEIPLPISKSVALTIDELLEALMTACRDNDLVRFKQVLVHHIEHQGVAVRVGEAPHTAFTARSELAKLQPLKDWSHATSFMKQFVDFLYLDIIAALDAEWSSYYFSGRQTAPLFPLVMVRPQPVLMEGRVPKSRKNLLFRPTRRLLEFLYALVFYIRRKRWPAKPPRPQTLADILYRPGTQEVLDSSVVSSYFDGSTKLTWDRTYDHWIQMCHRFMPEQKTGASARPPYPMIVLALQWQALLVQDGGKSFLMPDMERYNLLWQHRRRHWDELQAKQGPFASHASHKTGEPIEWPAWMLNQFSSES